MANGISPGGIIGGPSFGGGTTLNDFNDIGAVNTSNFLQTVGDIQTQSGQDTVAAARRQVIRNQQNRAFDEAVQRLGDGITQFKNIVNNLGGLGGA